MRKITQEIAKAFYEGNSLKRGNTTTDGEKVYLFGNLIATMESPNPASLDIFPKGDRLYLTLAGWNTTTTRERLNGILETLGFDERYTQKDYMPKLDGFDIDPDEFQTFNL